MWKRVLAMLLTFFSILGILIIRTYTLTTGETLATSAQKQSTVKLKITESRGTIYYHDLQKITNADSHFVAAVMPIPAVVPFLENYTTNSENIRGQVLKGKPFLFPLMQEIPEGDGVLSFEIYNQYSQNQSLEHLIGVMDYSGKTGESGLQKAFDKWLSSAAGEIEVSYKTNAIGNVILGENAVVNNTQYRSAQGVVLTVDKEIQEIAENAGNGEINSGCIIISQVPNNEILASVSYPRFSPLNLGDYMDNEDAPFVNKTISSYNVGSTFKLVAAAAALENGYSEEEEYYCLGHIDVGGVEFKCSGNKEHGAINMKEAISKSCNCYFIQLMQKVGPDAFLQQAKKLGFGEADELAPGYTTSSGNLPSSEKLLLPAELANFSFGQGVLLATPLQISTLTNTIASGGMYSPPYLVTDLVDSDLNSVKRYYLPEKKRVFSVKTAETLMSFMQQCVQEGTGSPGLPEQGGAGAKTGTAETGIYNESGRQIEQFWYTGYYPEENPKYCITILAQNGISGGKTCGPIFKDICDELAKIDSELNL